jgi:cysteine desulfurase/selenocysteine lyase
MISTVTLEKSDFQDAPFRFEAGTPNISGVVAFKPAVDYFSQLNLEQLQTHESQLLSVAAAKLQEFGGVQVLGSLTQKRAGILSMSFSDMHASDVGQILDQEGVAVRVGHLCTQPLLSRFKATSLLRASFSIYNNENDVTRFMEALQKARSMLV